MELIEKPPKTKLSTAAKDYFSRYPSAMAVGFLTKEGREFWFRRDPQTGEPAKVTRSEAERL